MTKLRRIGALALLAMLIAGCTVQLRTASAPTDGCDMALLTGRLVADSRSGLAFESTTGEVTQAIWPFGYSARREPTGGVSLLDEKGAVIAHEGDWVEVGGGLGTDAWGVCAGSLHVVPAPA